MRRRRRVGGSPNRARKVLETLAAEALPQAAGIPASVMAERLGPAPERTTLALTRLVPRGVSDPITHDSLQRSGHIRTLMSGFARFVRRLPKGHLPEDFRLCMEQTVSRLW